jgi:transposase
MSTARKPYPSDVSDAEWTLLVPYLTLMREDAPQREYSMRVLFNAIQYVVKTGCTWRFLPHDFPPWSAVYQQARRWLAAGVFEQIAHDLRIILRIFSDKEHQPSAVIFDARTMQSTPESGARAGYDGHKKKNGCKVHIAVDTLGNLLALHVIHSLADQKKKSPNLSASPSITEQGTPSAFKRIAEANAKRQAAGQPPIK